MAAQDLPPSRATSAARTLRRALPLVECLLVFGLTFGALRPPPADPEVHLDTAAGLLATRDCVEGDACLLRLNPHGGASVSGVFHGALHLRVLLVLALLEASPTAPYELARVSVGLAAVLLFVAARRLYGSAAGFAAVLLLAALFQGPHRLPLGMVWNANWVPLPAAGFVLAAARYLEVPRLRFLVAASFLAGLALQAHVAAGALALALFALLTWAPGRLRAAHALVAAATLVGCIQLGSPAMFLDVEVLRSTGAGAGTGASATKLLALALFAGSAAVLLLARRVTDVRWRVPLFLGATFLPLEALLLLATHGENRYFYALVPGLALLPVGVLAPVLGLVFRRIPFARALSPAAALLLAGWFALHQWGVALDVRQNPLRIHTITEGQAGQLSDHLAARGWSFAEAFRRLRGGMDLPELMSGLASRLPEQGTQRDTAHVAVFRPPAAALPADLPAGWTRLGQSDPALLLYEFEPVLRFDEVRVCHLDPHGDAACSWLRGRYAIERAFHPVDEGRFWNRYWPSARVLDRAARCPSVAVVALRAELPAGAERHLALTRMDRHDACRAAVLDVHGIEGRGDGGAAVTLAAGEAPAAGWVSIAVDLCDPACALGHNGGLLPPLVEGDEADLAKVAGLVGAAPDTPEFVALRERLRARAANLPVAPAQEVGGHGTPFPPEHVSSRAYALASALLLFAGLLGSMVVSLRAAQDATGAPPAQG